MHSFLKISAGASALALAMTAAPASAANFILDFSGNICGATGDQACGSGSQIGQNYGDNAMVNVSYRSITASTGDTFENFLKYWDGNYGDLTGVIWGGTNNADYISEITFAATAGNEIGLWGFDFATYFGRSASAPFMITGLNGDVLFDASQSTNYPSHGYVNAMTGYRSDGFIIRWGPDSYDVGLDNIEFDARAISGAVPEPATWAMLIFGFGAIGGAMRSRRKANVKVSCA